jgi:hypothetical protein
MTLLLPFPNPIPSLTLITSTMKVQPQTSQFLLHHRTRKRPRLFNPHNVITKGQNKSVKIRVCTV